MIGEYIIGTLPDGFQGKVNTVLFYALLKTTSFSTSLCSTAF